MIQIKNEKQINKGKKIMENIELMQVAETIRSQIHPTVLMCAAARSFHATENKEGLFGISFIISNTSKIKYATVKIYLKQHVGASAESIVKIGDMVDVKVIKVDDTGRISLSAKALIEKEKTN